MTTEDMKPDAPAESAQADQSNVEANAPVSTDATTSAAPQVNDQSTVPVTDAPAAPVADVPWAAPAPAAIDENGNAAHIPAPGNDPVVPAPLVGGTPAAVDSVTPASDTPATEQEAAAEVSAPAPLVPLVSTALLGSLVSNPVTPDGTPVPEAQPDAVTVKGPEYPANSPALAATGVAVANDYFDLSHTDMLTKLLNELEGAANMGKAEIIAALHRARVAFEG